jgi:hypothetical protein
MKYWGILSFHFLHTRVEKMEGEEESTKDKKRE